MELLNQLSRNSTAQSFTSARTTLEPKAKNLSAPHPKSSPQDIQQFLPDFFIANKPSIDREKADELASRLEVNGESLYMISKDGLRQLFGAEGEAIYGILEYGRCGCVSLVLKMTLRREPSRLSLGPSIGGFFGASHRGFRSRYRFGRHFIRSIPAYHRTQKSRVQDIICRNWSRHQHFHHP